MGGGGGDVELNSVKSKGGVNFGKSLIGGLRSICLDSFHKAQARVGSCPCAHP